MQSMDLFGRLAEKLPTGAEPAKAISLLNRNITEQTGDMRAFCHVHLYKTYSTLARERPFFAKPFNHLAQHHLHEALVWANLWPQPWAILGESQLKKGDLWGGLENLEKFIVMQRLRMQSHSDSDSSERLDLCRCLTWAASTRCQLGQFARGRDGFAEALKEFKQLEVEVRIRENTIEDSIVLGISGCLLLEHRYADAEQFIDKVLAEEVLSAYPSSAHLRLVASKEMIAGLVDETRDFQSPPFAEDLWAALMNDIQRCETPEAAREARKTILRTIKTKDVNPQVQKLAVAVEKVMKQQESALQSVQVPQLITVDLANTDAIDLTKISDPALRRVTDARIREFNLTQKEIHDVRQSLSELTVKLIESNIAGVRDIADKVYRVPLRHQAEWLLLNTARFIVQIVAISYVLDRFVSKGIEHSGKSLSEILNLEHKEIIIVIIVLVVGYEAGRIAEKRIDDWFLTEYKRLLSRVVVNGSNRLWAAYNTFLKLLAETKQGLSDFEAMKT